MRYRQDICSSLTNDELIKIADEPSSVAALRKVANAAARHALHEIVITILSGGEHIGNAGAGYSGGPASQGFYIGNAGTGHGGGGGGGR